MWHFYFKGLCMIPSWDDKYSIHNEEIDDQHKKLFSLAKKAYIYANRNISKDDMKGIISEFFEYMKEHFTKEEEFMQRIGYPDLPEHARIHKNIVVSMSNLIKTTRNINDMKENLIVIAERWLLEHILQQDLKIEEWRRANISKQELAKTQSPDTKYDYICGCDGKIHKISQAVHNNILSGKKYSCTVCKQAIRHKD